jgi:hypothetical protein
MAGLITPPFLFGAEMEIRQLKQGDKFRLDYGKYGYQDFKLIYVNECRAYVEPIAEKDILGDDNKRGGRINISPGADCIPLDDEDDFITGGATMTMKDPLDDDDDDFFGDATPAAAPKKPRAKRTNGNRRKEPGTQTRAIKDGTIRAKLFAAMKTTKSIEKLMVKTGMAKNLLLSHINDIWRHHGFGYSVDGDKVELIPPKKVSI